MLLKHIYSNGDYVTGYALMVAMLNIAYWRSKEERTPKEHAFYMAAIIFWPLALLIFLVDAVSSNDSAYEKSNLLNTNKIIKIVLAGLFLICLLDMPYGYFELVRFIGMFGFIYLGLKDEVRNEVIYFWFASAVLINPIYKIPLGRELWNVIDVIWGIILIYTVLQKQQMKKIE